MNVIIGRIYQARWGRYVGHRPGVLRSLDTPNAFSIHPDPDLHIDTGEDYVIGHVRGDMERDARGDEGGARREADHAFERGAGGPPGVPLAVQDAGRTDPADQPLGGGPAGEHADRRTARPPAPLTLGGHRPGAYIITSRNDLWWRPCLTRAPEGGIPHVYFLEPASWPSLYCPACFATKGDVLEAAGRVRDLLAAGKTAEATGLFADHPMARMFLRISIRKCARTHEWAQTGPEADGGPVPGVLQAPVEAVSGSERRALDVTAGETAIERQEVPGVTAGETAPSGVPAIPSDDPKAEAGSFERPELWRPRYQSRDDWDEWRRERAAIFEFEGGMQRKYAELAANRLAGPPP